MRCMPMPNTEASTPEKFYRVTNALKYIDAFLSKLNDRFMAHKQIVCGFYKLLPSKCNSITKSWLLDHLSVNKTCIDMDSVWAEIRIWKKLSTLENAPKNAVADIECCEKSQFPNLYFLLNFLLNTFPVQTTTPKRSFSTLRRLKTYLNMYLYMCV